MDFELLKTKNRGFTDSEIALMEEWLAGVLQGHLRLANRVLRTGLLLEHWQSLLDADPAKHSGEEQGFEAQLRVEFEEARSALRAAMEDRTVPAERGEVLRREGE